MRKIFRFVTLCLTLASLHVNAETVAQYVSACKSQLNFQSIPIPNPRNLSPAPTTIDCYSGDLFQTPNDYGQNSFVDDYVGHLKVTDQVDLVFACRWLQSDQPNNPVSVEMLIHNRQNGNTCFFSANQPGFNFPGPSSSIVPPTASTAASFWDDPATLNAEVPCIACHISGPYIATPTIAPFLAKDGLMNDGHDTGANVTNGDMTQSFNKAHVKYHAVVTPNVTSVFSQWDSLKQSYMDPGTTVNSDPGAGCSVGCHVIGTLSPTNDLGQIQRGLVVILHRPESQLDEINHANAMAPYDDGSDYRWINLDTPGDGVESENFAGAMGASGMLIPHLFDNNNYNCIPDGVTNILPGASNNKPSVSNDVPADMEAHAVGIDASNSFVYSQVSWITEKLKYFNLKDGLVCLNSDQDPGVSCRDFDVSYLCNNGAWTSFYNHTVNSSGGDDHEERSYVNSQVVAACGNTQPIGIRARLFLAARGGPSPQIVIGPNDRLARLSQYGLTCNNSDQPDGQCSNYVVRYHYCGNPPASSYTAHLTSTYTGKQLTATSSSNNALVKGQPFTSTWSTQQWSIEPVANTEYVRLRDTGTNTYLNVTSQSESAAVVSSSLSSATSEMWILESVTYSSDYRLKNLWTGKYLTIADTSTYASINSQTKNPGWTSQRWSIQ